MQNLHTQLLTELAHSAIDERLRTAAGMRAVPNRRRGRPRHRFPSARA